MVCTWPQLHLKLREGLVPEAEMRCRRSKSRAQTGAIEVRLMCDACVSCSRHACCEPLQNTSFARSAMAITALQVCGAGTQPRVRAMQTGLTLLERCVLVLCCVLLLS